MQYYFGISGGHHKSTGVAIRDDRIVATVNEESLNLHGNPPHNVATRLGGLLNSLAEEVGLRPNETSPGNTSLCLALPGASSESDRDLAQYCLGWCGWKNRLQWQIVDDTWAGLAAGTLSGYGICAFAGTGASVYVGLGDFPWNRSRKFDGWGPVLGDFGSGFQLSADLFRTIARRSDEGSILPLFTEVVAREPDIGSLGDAQQWFDGLFIVHPFGWRVRFAELAAVVTRAADREPPDPDARVLVMRSAKEMAVTIMTAIRDLKPGTDGLPIIFQGGMFEHSALYRETVARTVRAMYPNPIRMAPYRTVVGAALISAGEGGHIPAPPRCDRILKSISERPAAEQAELVYNAWEYTPRAEGANADSGK